MRLRRRIFLSYLGVSLVLVLAGGAILSAELTRAAREGIDARLTTALRLVGAELESTSAFSETDLDDRVDGLASAAGARITLVGLDGRVLADSDFDGAALAALDDHGGRAEVVEARTTGEGTSERYSRSLGVDLLYMALRLDSGPWRGSVVRVAEPLTRVAVAQRTAWLKLLVALGIALVLALAAGAALARRLSRPILALSRVAERARVGDLGASVRVDTGDEIEALARALFSARDRLADQIHAAQAERDQLEAVLDGMVEGVIVTEADGRVALANAAIGPMLGAEGAVVGRTVLEAVRNPDVADAMAEATRSGSGVEREVRLSYPADRVLDLHAAGLATGGAVGVFHDITSLKRLDAVRRDFVANVSHELRTPLATLGGYAEALAGGGDGPDDVRLAADAIRRNVDRLNALVGDLLELSRIEADGFEPTLAAFDPDDLVEELAAEWRSKARARDMQLVVEPAAGGPVLADRRLLRQALFNLLDNAIRYCPPGTGIRIEAHRDGDGGVAFVVADDGPGIPVDDQPRIFERFYRVEKGRTRQDGGTGLGLAIVKHVAEVHGGRVELASEPGAGSRFRLVVPAAD